MANRKESMQNSSQRTFIPSIVDNSKLRNFSSIAKVVDREIVGHSSMNENDNSMKNRLKNIQG